MCVRHHVGVDNGLITVGHYIQIPRVFTTPLTQIMRTKRGQFHRFVLHASALYYCHGARARWGAGSAGRHESKQTLQQRPSRDLLI